MWSAGSPSLAFLEPLPPGEVARRRRSRDGGGTHAKRADWCVARCGAGFVRDAGAGSPSRVSGTSPSGRGGPATRSRAEREPTRRHRTCVRRVAVRDAFCVLLPVPPLSKRHLPLKGENPDTARCSATRSGALPVPPLSLVLEPLPLGEVGRRRRSRVGEGTHAMTPDLCVARCGAGRCSGSPSVEATSPPKGRESRYGALQCGTRSGCCCRFPLCRVSGTSPSGGGGPATEEPGRRSYVNGLVFLRVL